MATHRVGGEVDAAVRRARAHAPQLVKVEVEVTRLDQLPAAIALIEQSNS